MVPSPGMIVQAALVVLGLWWCKEVLGRLRADIVKLRHGDRADRAVVIFFWALTAGIAALIGVFGFGLISRLVAGIRALMAL